MGKLIAVLIFLVWAGFTIFLTLRGLWRLLTGRRRRGAAGAGAFTGIGDWFTDGHGHGGFDGGGGDGGGH
jgi:hypothetical protein